MTNPSAVSEAVPSPDPLLAAVQEYQRLYACWSAADDLLEREQTRLQLRNVQEQLWSLIAGPLSQIAKGWAGSVIGKEHMSTQGDDALNSLALSLYIYVAEELPKLAIDPTKNVLGLLMTIVRRRLIDEQRKYMRDLSGPRSSTVGPFAAYTAPEGTMWPARMGAEPIYKDSALQDIIDPQSKDIEEQLIDRLYSQALWEDIQRYWQHTLTREDQSIVRRWEHDPPTPFRTIAENLGPGWSESMVRQRHYRIMRRTRQYLHERQEPATEH
jgi:hypothetical protein